MVLERSDVFAEVANANARLTKDREVPEEIRKQTIKTYYSNVNERGVA